MLIWGALGFFVATILGVVGAGGGIVAIPLFIELGGYDLRAASVLSLGVVAMAAFFNWLPKQRYTLYRESILILLGAIVMIFATIPLKQKALPWVLVLMLNLVGIFSLYNVWFNDKPAKNCRIPLTARAETSHLFKILLMGVLVGFLTTMIGVGGGVFLVVGLRYIFCFDIERAVATSLFNSIFIPLASLFAQQATGISTVSVDWLSIGILCSTAALTSYILHSLLDYLKPHHLHMFRKWGLTTIVGATMLGTLDTFWAN